MNSNTATFFFLTNEEIKQINLFLLIKKNTKILHRKINYVLQKITRKTLNNLQLSLPGRKVTKNMINVKS